VGKQPIYKLAKPNSSLRREGGRGGSSNSTSLLEHLT